MTKSKIFLAALIVFCVGIGLHSHVPYSPNVFGKMAVGLLAIMLGMSALNHLLSPNRYNTTILTVLILLVVFNAGIYRGQSTIHLSTPETIDYYTQASSSMPSSRSSPTVTIIGTIAEEPDVRRDKINYTIHAQQIKTHDETKNVSGYVLISANKYPQYRFGDRLEISGHLQKPAIFVTFDYAGYLSRFDIYSVMYRPRIELVENPKHEILNPKKTQNNESVWSFSDWNFELVSDLDLRISNFKTWFFENLLVLKGSFESQLNLTFPTEPTSSFMAGLLLGSRKGMPEELTKDFQTTGLTHIVAISGYNITLIVSILMAVFKPFGKRISLLLSAFGIILFTLFVGASPAVVRACIMGLIALLALHAERKGNISIILAFTATMMIGWNPKILLHDVGFQLSFLATMGLIYVSPLLEPYLRWLPKKLVIRDSVNLSLSAQIMALPVIVLNFHNLSLVSPLSNLLVAGPFIPFAMLFGFLGTMASYLSLAIAKLIAYPGYLLLHYIVFVIETTADVPYAAISIGWFSEAMFATYFLLLTLFLQHSWKRNHQRETTIRELQLLFEHRVVERVWLKIP